MLNRYMNMADKKIRSWVALLQYAGREKYRFGSVVVDAGAQTHEIESAILLSHAKLQPENVGNPKVLAMEPGAIFFVPEHE